MQEPTIRKRQTSKHNRTLAQVCDSVTAARAPASAAMCLDLVRKMGRYTQAGIFGAPFQADLDKVILKQLRAAGEQWRKEVVGKQKKALWQQQREALKHIDLSDDTKRQVVIARGSPEPGAYHAHPTTAMLADNKTIFCVWNIGHGGHAGPMARSDDGGMTWTRMDDALPPNYVNFRNCPSIYRITDPQGKERLWVFAARTATDKEVIKDIPGRLQGYMPRIVSEDDGKTWRELPPIGGRIAKDDPFRSIMTFSSIVRLKDGSSLGMFHRGGGIGEGGTLQVLQSITRDGGFTWSQPILVCDGTKLDGKHPCEPYVFRSPDGDELCCLMRENKRSGTRLVMFSRDEGKTWSQAVDAPCPARRARDAHGPRVQAASRWRRHPRHHPPQRPRSLEGGD